ncbi:hypothetical protein C8R44DRAFT_726247 [Mycena epipterygia]|nr:hypothetical protein C8R44DRAFT_726247 [Mycena epipterygia]
MPVYYTLNIATTAAGILRVENGRIAPGAELCAAGAGNVWLTSSESSTSSVFLGRQFRLRYLLRRSTARNSAARRISSPTIRARTTIRVDSGDCPVLVVHAKFKRAIHLEGVVADGGKADAAAGENADTPAENDVDVAAGDVEVEVMLAATLLVPFLTPPLLLIRLCLCHPNLSLWRNLPWPLFESPANKSMSVLFIDTQWENQFRGGSALYNEGRIEVIFRDGSWLPLFIKPLTEVSHKLDSLLIWDTKYRGLRSKDSSARHANLNTPRMVTVLWPTSYWGSRSKRSFMIIDCIPWWRLVSQETRNAPEPPAQPPASISFRFLAAFVAATRDLVPLLKCFASKEGVGFDASYRVATVAMVFFSGSESSISTRFFWADSRNSFPASPDALDSWAPLWNAFPLLTSHNVAKFIYSARFRKFVDVANNLGD